MNPSSTITGTDTGRSNLWLGLGLAVLGIAAYVAQYYMAWLKAPWYAPVAATIGVILIAASLWRQRSAWRVLALILVVMLAGVEWLFMFAFRYPDYAGPAMVGQPFPTFTTKKSDGQPFTSAMLKGEQHTAMVFFRGRW